ncbi:hypothetical protein J2X55_002542 [Microbacterium sp. 1154]|uniref:LmeA family phospholipid-binding protein n=1 Tax=Microbacterium sp. 1154 TaxID=2817733 RepID=UPI002859D80E|nr:LmeA family phospholipid-binding protein [Microbacterium sp. 1154]MDR6691619.1 hypothetical protein [Microbacterium sp. 1154]
MTLFDERTELLPSAQTPEPSEPDRPGLGLRVAILVVVIIALAATAFATAEGLMHAERERAIVGEARTMFALPASQRIEVDIPGSVLLQELLGRFDRVGLTVHSFSTGPTTSDLTMTVEGFHDADGIWTADHLSAVATLSAAQTTALVVPPEAQGAMRVGFSGDDIVFAASVPAGAAPQSVSVAMTPHFDGGRVGIRLTSVTVGGKTLSAEEMRAESGVDLAAMQPAPVCLSEALPRFLRVHDVRVSDQRFRIEFDADLRAAETAAGLLPGTCP